MEYDISKLAEYDIIILGLHKFPGEVITKTGKSVNPVRNKISNGVNEILEGMFMPVLADKLFDD
ncbi:MAG: hypothetical protein ABIH40_05190 [Candidatus Omnitrophota bacterium]